MAAFDHSLLPRADEVLHQLVKRKNWAAKNPGVILVFCIVFTIAVLLIVLLTMKKLAARKASKA